MQTARRPRQQEESRSSFESLRPTRRTVVWLLVAAAVVAGVVSLIAKSGELDDIANALRMADYRWLALCFIGEIASYSGYIFAYRDFARVRGGPHLPTALAGEVVVIGIGATALGSAPGGLAVDYWALNRAGSSRREAVRRVLGLNTTKWFSLAVLASIAGCFGLLGAGTAPLAMAIVWPCVVALCVVLAILLAFGARGARFATPPVQPEARFEGAKTVGRWSRFALVEAFSDSIGGIQYLRALYAQPGRHRAGVAGFPLYWAGDMLAFWAALRAFGVELDPATLTLAYATGYVATGLPLPIGGSGGVEAAMTFSLTACGVPLTQALLGVVCYRLFDFWLPLLPALAVIPRVRHVDSRLAAIAAARQASQ